MLQTEGIATTNVRPKTLRGWRIKLQIALQGPDLKSRAEIHLRLLCMPGGYTVSRQWALGPRESLPIRGPAKASGVYAEGTVWLLWLEVSAANPLC